MGRRIQEIGIIPLSVYIDLITQTILHQGKCHDPAVDPGTGLSARKDLSCTGDFLIYIQTCFFQDLFCMTV